MNADSLNKAQEWAHNHYFDYDFRQAIAKLIEKNDIDEINDRFSKNLEFGTGGLRGIIGEGSNRMNIYTVRKTTQALANYINSTTKQGSVVVAFDSRRFSKEFAENVASVCIANDIKVLFFQKIHATPMLSYAIRYLKATAGVIITASHNPPHYNGYKVSWSNGSQIVEPHDLGIIDCFNKISSFSEINNTSFFEAQNSNLFEYIDEIIDSAYFQDVENLSVSVPEANRDFGILYTPLHGVGKEFVKAIMTKRGFNSFHVVPSQEFPDEDFPTLKYPNPEEESAFDEALKYINEDDQLIIATDPDADRIGVMAKHKNKWSKINGNEIGALLLNSYLKALQAKNQIPENGFYLLTIVTSEIGKKIADHYGLKYYETLTGFKYLGNKASELINNENMQFVFANEESHGYQFGNFIREKDGISACMMFAEMTALIAKENKSIIDALRELHEQFGYHVDSLLDVTLQGLAGKKMISQIMDYFRNEKIEFFDDMKIISMIDYHQQKKYSLIDRSQVEYNHLPQSNVIAFFLEDQTRITLRPSGTEPKIKFYFNLQGDNKKNISKKRLQYEAYIHKILGTHFSIIL